MNEKTTDFSEQKKTERRKVPKKVNLADLPKRFREALGISPDIHSMSEIVEKDQLVQKALKNTMPEFYQEEGLDEDEEFDGKNRKFCTPKVLLEKRNTRIILLGMAGLKTKTILDTVNARDKVERWGILKNTRAINKVREKFHWNPRPLYYENMEEKELVEGGIHKQKELIEKFTLAIGDEPKDDGKSIVARTNAQFKLIQLQQLFITNQGRNASRYYKTTKKKEAEEDISE